MSTIDCKRCTFWWQTSVNSGTGECRINPPTIHNSAGTGCWPLTRDRDACGHARPFPVLNRKQTLDARQ
jgi:hypothetical protein